jgi:hypothetical protein
VTQTPLDSAEPARQGAGWLPLAALALLVASMVFGLILPIYTDEIAWRFHQRAWLDNGFDVWMNDVCGPHMVAAAPLFMLPVRWFSATMNQWLDDPLWIRATGVVLGLLLVAGFWRLAGLLEPDVQRRGLLRAIICGVLACGVLPLLLIFSRPEQPVFLAALGMAVLALPALRRDISARRAWLVCAGLVLLTLVGLSYHLKGLLYSVFALACLAMLAGGTRHIVPRALAAAAIVVLDLVAAQYWMGRFSCPDNAVMAAELDAQNLFAMIANGQATVATLTGQLLGAHILGYVSLAAIHPYPMSSWMPVKVFTAVDGLAGHALAYAVWLTPSLLAVAGVVAFLRRKGWRGLFEPRVFLAGTLFAITSLWAFSQITRNVYEASHMLPAWALALLFALTLRTVPTATSATTLRKLAVLVVVLSAISQVIVIGRMSGPLWAAAHDPGRLPLQQYSFSLADYPAVRADISAAMQQAGMGMDGASSGTGPDGRLNRLLIDDVTYLALQRSYLPIHALGVMGPWNGPIDDPATYLVSRSSDGVVATCASLWQDAADVAARAGEICAINRQQLQALAGGRPFVPASATAPVPLADGAYAPLSR